MPQVHLHAVVPVLDGDAFGRVAVIIAGVVHQRPDRSVAQPGLGNGPSQSVDVADVALDEMRNRVTLLMYAFHNSARWFLGDVNEADLGPLFALVERAGEGQLKLTEMAGLFWHCLKEQNGLTRDMVGEAVMQTGLAECAAPLRSILAQILQGAG